jgi:TRAP-type uncharacterized transport system substrate-binding protein
MKRLLFLIATTLILAPALAGAQDYRFVSGPQGGNWFVLGGAISSYFTEAGMNTSSSTGGGVSNIINVSKGKADLGFSVGSLVGAAITGQGEFKRKVDNAVLLGNLYPQITYFIARKDFVEENGVKTLKEFVVSSLLKLGYDKDWQGIKENGGQVQFASYSDGAGLIADNHIDIFAFSVGPIASIIMNIESQTDIVILPVDEEPLQKLSDSYGTGTHYIEPGIYKSVTEKVPTVGDNTVCIVRGDLPDDVVSKMAEALLKNRDNLATTIKDFSAFNAKSAVAEKLPMHPAAKAYFESQQ